MIRRELKRILDGGIDESDRKIPYVEGLSENSKKIYVEGTLDDEDYIGWEPVDQGELNIETRNSVLLGKEIEEVSGKKLRQEMAEYVDSYFFGSFYKRLKNPINKNTNIPGKTCEFDEVCIEGILENQDFPINIVGKNGERLSGIIFAFAKAKHDIVPILFDNDDGKIYYTDHEYDPYDVNPPHALIADSLQEFLENIA
jgi:hypothetical protein